MKVIIITRDLQPYGGPNPGWYERSSTLAKYFSSKGFETHTVSAFRYGKQKNDNDIPNVFNHYIKSFWWSFDHVQNQDFLILRLLQFTNIIVRKLINNYIVDVYSPISLEIKKKLNNEIFKEVDLIIVSTPPHSLLKLIPWLRKKFPKAMLIADLRDPWSFRSTFKKKWKWRNDLNNQFELKWLNTFDLVVVVSDRMKKKYQKIIKSSITVIENGYDDIFINHNCTENSNNKKIQKYTLGYCGSGGFELFRNDGKSLHNFIKYTDKSLESLNFNLELRTFGNITGDPPPTSNLKIKIFKPIKNSDVVIKISEFLLNVYVLNEFEDADVVLGGKLYDYVYASRPILFLIPQNAFSIIKFCQKFQIQLELYLLIKKKNNY